MPFRKSTDAAKTSGWKATLRAFVLLVAVFMLGFVGLAYSIYPYVVIDRLTMWEAASSPATLKVTLAGVCISVPAIAAYTAYSYRVFGGKATELHYG